MAKPTDRVRKGTYQRENGRCVRCSTGDGLSYQHRAGDGMGGDPHPPGWEDGVTACLVCNQGFDGNAEQQDEALCLGWKVPRWVRRQGLSAEVPYFDRPTNRWYRLDPDAPIRHPIPIRVAARMMLTVYGPDGPTGRKTRDLVPSG